MTVFNSKEQNTFHYLTMVCFDRVPVFKSQIACQIFIDVLAETREKHPFKLIGYVIMPNHVHLILNPVECDISLIGKELKGKSGKRIIDWLKENNYQSSLEKIALPKTQKRNHSFAVWQKKVTSIDLTSPKFIRQKLHYIHLNPIRAGLCEHPAKWKWSSYHAYLPHKHGEVPIEMDIQGYWKEEEFENYNEKSNAV
jgi:putative transposase